MCGEVGKEEGRGGGGGGGGGGRGEVVEVNIYCNVLFPPCHPHSDTHTQTHRHTDTQTHTHTPPPLSSHPILQRRSLSIDDQFLNLRAHEVLLLKREVERDQLKHEHPERVDVHLHNRPRPLMTSSTHF